MRHGQAWWSRHVGGWRSSGLSQAEYCRRHGIVAGSLARWSSKLKEESGVGKQLVEVDRSGTGQGLRAEGSARAIELVVEGRYLLRLWPGTDGGHLRQVLSVLEDCR